MIQKPIILDREEEFWKGGKFMIAGKVFMVIRQRFRVSETRFSYKTTTEPKKNRLRRSLNTKTVKRHHKNPNGKFSEAKILDRAKSKK